MVEIDITPRAAPADDTGEKKSASTVLIELASGRYDFGITDDGLPYAVQPGRHVVRPLRGGRLSLRAELSREYYKLHRRAAPQQALADALLALEGMAQEADPTTVHLRVAAADGAIWVDLADAAETVIRVSAGGWQIVDRHVPVLFRRTQLTGVMPTPAYTGDLDRLWAHLNVAPEDRPLVLAWLVATFVDPDMPHPVLAMFGEQGTGKSTASRRLVELADPSPVPLRKPPRDAESWVTAAAGSWVVGLDNLSTVADWLSDSLCRAATGEGDVKRQLYTDGQLAVFAFRRCILLNGIDVGALRGDLADRVLMVNLQRITEAERLTERQLTDEWSSDYPVILAALFDLVAGVMVVLPSVHLANKPRMADFARVLAGVDHVLGTQGLARFAGQARSMAEDTLSADPFLAAVQDKIRDFTGTAADLLHQLTPGDDWRPPRGWPKNPRHVTSLLKRNAPALRKAGWTVETELNRTGTLEWSIIRPADGLAQPEIAGNASLQPLRSLHDVASAGVAGMAGNEYGQSQDGRERPACAVCGRPMRLIEVGQTTHPGCVAA